MCWQNKNILLLIRKVSLWRDSLCFVFRHLTSEPVHKDCTAAAGARFATASRGDLLHRLQNFTHLNTSNYVNIGLRFENTRIHF